MAQPLVLSIDQGTTSTRAFVFDSAANVVALAQKAFQQHFPQPGYVEHDANEIWETVVETASKAIAEAEATGGQIVSIGITNQRETVVAWDRETLEPVGPAIVWQDRRTSALCRKLKDDGCEAIVQDRTGLLLDPYFSATKIAHILDSDQSLRSRAKDGKLAVGTIDSFLIARLTGGAHVTDSTNASRTSLFNLANNAWDADLLDMFNVPEACLPKVQDNIATFGDVLPNLFDRSIPIYASIGDQQSAAVGQACFGTGDVKSTYGTGCFLLAQTGDTLVRSKNRLLTTVSRRIDGKTSYAIEGSIFIAGAAVQWLRDALSTIDEAAESERVAESLDDSGGVFFVPAFAGLGAPYWDPDARGAILGLTRGTGREQIIRAALESVAFQTRDLIEAVESDGVKISSLKVDGGMVANDWLMQYLANILDTRVDRPVLLETTALGAALLAGIGAGVYESILDAAEVRRTDRVFESDMSQQRRESLLNGWRDAVGRVRTNA